MDEEQQLLPVRVVEAQGGTGGVDEVGTHRREVLDARSPDRPEVEAFLERAPLCLERGAGDVRGHVADQDLAVLAG